MYQFIHVESYSKVSAKKKLNYNNETKGRNVSDIIGEVTRKHGYCDHVEEPEAPTLLYGVHPEELEALTEDYFNNTKLINNKGIKRGLRKDSHILLAGVVSLNAELKDEIWDDYKKDAIKWLKEKYGDCLKCVVEHTDEANPHLHFYCVQNPGEDFNLLHEGKRAFQEESKKYKKEIAFKEAMRGFQEDFYNSVSVKYGLMKTGPKRQRLSNSDYKRQQQEIRLINLFKDKTTDEMNLLITETEKEIENQKIKANSEIISLKENAHALGKRLGKIEGVKSALNEVENKNYISKIIFSRSFSLKRINELEKRNSDLLDKSKKLFERKEYYKKVSTENIGYKNKYHEEEKKNNYLKTVNDLVENININKTENKKEMENDIRTRIIAEVNRIEAQQQQINSRYEEIRPRNDRNRKTIDDFKQRFKRSSRMFFNHFKTFVRDIFSNSIFERTIQRKEKINIQKIEYKKEESKTENTPDGKFNRKRKKLEI